MNAAPKLSAETADLLLAAHINAVSYAGPISRRRHGVALTIAIALVVVALVVFGVMA